jgi:hypothetical protein
MDILEKFIRKVAYKFPKGYPDISNPEDRALLEELIGENILLEVTEDYDARIKQVLGVDEIPRCKTPVQVGKDFNLSGEDEKIWKELYPVLPLKKDSDVPTAGAGKGEIAAYWAYQYNEKPIEAQDARQSEDPDLIIGGYGVEVKSYDANVITLGKFGRDKASIELLNQIFGTLALFTEDNIQGNTGNFKTSIVLAGFKVLEELIKDKSLQDLPVTKPFFSKITNLYTSLGLELGASAEEATSKLLKKMLWTKLSKKPNLGKDVGFILNVSEDGKGKYYKITEETVNNIPSERVLNNGIFVKSSEIQMNFPKLFN